MATELREESGAKHNSVKQMYFTVKYRRYIQPHAIPLGELCGRGVERFADGNDLLPLVFTHLQ